MKVLIVDDERHVVDAILLLVPWENLGITQTLTAYNVPQAIELLDRERPEIAIVDVVIEDRMGSEVLNHINARKMSTKVVVISGHDDYQYIRAMFVLGGVDYLLKPIEPDGIIAAVEKAVRQARCESGRSGRDFGVDQQVKRLLPDHQHGLFRKLFRQELRDAAYAELCQTNRRVLEAKSCVVLFSDGMFLPVGREEYLLQLSRFLNALQRELESANCGTLFQQNQPAPDIVILLYADYDRMLGRISAACESFASKEGFPVRFGQSQPLSFPEGIPEALRQARLAAGTLNGAEPAVRMVYENGMQPQRVPVDIQKENRLFSALLLGDRELLERSLDDWLSFLSGGVGRDQGSLRWLWESFRSLYVKWGRYFASRSEHFRYEREVQAGLLAEIYDRDWNRTMRQLREQLLDRLWEMQRQKELCTESGDGMRRIADYLELNYGQKLRQQDLADLFHLNKDYMCRRFKETFGEGMVNYLNGVRIRRAQELLVDSDLQIQEIADEVGFFDTKYFSRQFKKETGSTPAEYRQRHGTLPEQGKNEA